MIYRVVEYVVGCDGEHYGLDCPSTGCNAYGSQTRQECEEAAQKDGWHKVNSRRWLCRYCKGQAVLRGRLKEEVLK